MLRKRLFPLATTISTEHAAPVIAGMRRIGRRQLPNGYRTYHGPVETEIRENVIQAVVTFTGSEEFDLIHAAGLLSVRSFCGRSRHRECRSGIRVWSAQ